MPDLASSQPRYGDTRSPFCVPIDNPHYTRLLIVLTNGHSDHAFGWLDDNAEVHMCARFGRSDI